MRLIDIDEEEKPTEESEDHLDLFVPWQWKTELEIYPGSLCQPDNWINFQSNWSIIEASGQEELSNNQITGHRRPLASFRKSYVFHLDLDVFIGTFWWHRRKNVF